MIAIGTDGKLYSWGYSPYKQLVLGYNPYPMSTPQLVDAGTQWLKVYTDTYLCFAIKDTNNNGIGGVLYTWGNGISGQDSAPNTRSVSTPTRVGRRTRWKSMAIGGNTRSVSLRMVCCWAGASIFMGHWGMRAARIRCIARPRCRTRGRLKLLRPAMIFCDLRRLG